MARMSPAAPSSPCAEGEEPPCRCGWFDSSHDLRDGLNVTEHAEPNTVAALVPLGWWLQWELEAAAQSVAVGRHSSHPSGH